MGSGACGFVLGLGGFSPLGFSGSGFRFSRFSLRRAGSCPDVAPVFSAAVERRWRREERGEFGGEDQRDDIYIERGDESA